LPKYGIDLREKLYATDYGLVSGRSNLPIATSNCYRFVSYYGPFFNLVEGTQAETLDWRGFWPIAVKGQRYER
jgi:hypothetical protein